LGPIKEIRGKSENISTCESFYKPHILKYYKINHYGLLDSIIMKRCNSKENNILNLEWIL
jgi:hypothetical protein